MDRILIVAVACRLPAWATAARDEYLRRLPRGFAARCIEVKAEPRAGGRTLAAMLGAEAARIRAALPRATRVVALDERGRDQTTAAFAARLRGWIDAGDPLAFVIGGADGLDAALKRDAAMQLRLSSMTLPHALAQVLLCEQLYRAAALLTGHPYHRA